MKWYFFSYISAYYDKFYHDKCLYMRKFIAISAFLWENLSFIIWRSDVPLPAHGGRG